MAARMTPQEPGADSSTAAGDPSLKNLLKRLADDATGLMRSELALAKLEMKQAGRDLATDAAKVGAAIALAAVGGLALTAAAILLLGRLFGGAYWASALVVGVTLLAVGGILAQRGLRGLREQQMRPAATLETLREDGRWAGESAQQLRERLMSGTTATGQ